MAALWQPGVPQPSSPQLVEAEMWLPGWVSVPQAWESRRGSAFRTVLAVIGLEGPQCSWAFSVQPGGHPREEAGLSWR